MFTVDDILREMRHSRIITVRMNEDGGHRCPHHEAGEYLLRRGEGRVPDRGQYRGRRLFERDVTRALVDHGANAPGLTVASFIRRAVISCRLSDSIHTVLRLMNEHEVRHLPVIEEHGLVGVISATDLIRHYLHEEEEADAQPGVAQGA